MGDYDKALMEFYTRVYAASISSGRTNSTAQATARAALTDFKSQFPRPDCRRAD